MNPFPFLDNNILESSLETKIEKNGVVFDKLELIPYLFPLLCPNDKDINYKKIDFYVSKFICFLEQKIKRKISIDQNNNFIQGLINIQKTQPATNERIASINYLFELKFLDAADITA